MAAFSASVSRRVLASKQLIGRSFSVSSAILGPKVAVVLSGSGVYDGSEIHEASACLVHLTRGGAEPVMFAPDIQQLHVINHIKGEPAHNEIRNVLAESARIARGKIQPLSELKASAHDAIVFPGGFGIAKNLSNLAVDEPNCNVNPDVVRVIKEFHAAKKPLALCCIAPILAAKIIPGVEITLGQEKDDGSGKWPYAGTVDVVKKWGAKHTSTNIDAVVVDEKNLVVTAPAFMYNTQKFHEVFDSVGNMITALLRLISK